MIDQIFTDIQTRLSAIKDSEGADLLKHFDLWNQQVDFMEKENPFNRPACFVEILPIQWAQLGGNLQQAPVTIKLHIVTDWFAQTAKYNPNQAESIKYLGLSQKVFDAMNKFTVDGSNQFVCVDTIPNHNHERYVDTVEVYRGLVQRQAQQGDFTERVVTPKINEISFTPTPLFDLTFNVTGDGDPLSQAVIVLLGHENKATNANGQAVYTDMPAGTYNFMIVYGGEVKRTDSITITDADAEYTHNIGVYPVDLLDHKYDFNVTFESGGTTYVRDLRGNKDIPIVGVDTDGKTIYDFSPLNDQRFNKNAYFGNQWGYPQYYNSPWNDYFYYNSQFPYRWKAEDFHRFYLEKQIIDTTVNDSIFLNARALDPMQLELRETIELFIYSEELTGDDLDTMLIYTGIQADFYGDNVIINGEDWVDSNSDGVPDDWYVQANFISSIITNYGKKAVRLDRIAVGTTYFYQLSSYTADIALLEVTYRSNGGIIISNSITPDISISPNISEPTTYVQEVVIRKIGTTIRLFDDYIGLVGNWFEIYDFSIKYKYQNYYKAD